METERKGANGVAYVGKVVKKDLIFEPVVEKPKKRKKRKNK